MGYAVIHSRALDGLGAPPVQVEVHLANGLPCLTLVGLVDTEVREARERVRSALAHTPMGYPMNQRITVNLAPADLPKESGRFDLPIALGILAAQGALDAQMLKSYEFAGELSLAGDLRPVRGALALALALRHHSGQCGDSAAAPRTLVLPHGSAEEAALVDGVRVCRAAHLMEVVQALGPGGQGLQPLPHATSHNDPPGGPSQAFADLRDVRGQSAAKRALEVAAAGGHSLLLTGPPGSGKSMLAQRLPGLLPPMTDEEALSSAAVASIAGSGLSSVQWRRRPFRAPHHSASAAALVGGGTPPRPGEISRAHQGVLFLDELPEFPRRALESLREPLETGEVVLSRAARQARFPCAFLLVAAMNPCPCGWLGATPGAGPACRCTPEAVLRYQGRLSGPLLDRLDLQVDVPPTAHGDLMGPPTGDDSARVAERVARCRLRQMDRQGCSNAALKADDVVRMARLTPESMAWAEQAAARMGWTGRSLHRALRVARTVADLDQADQVGIRHLAEALQWRRGLEQPAALPSGFSPAVAPGAGARRPG